MGRTNKVILIFIFIVAFLFAGVWQIIQTERFAKLVNDKLTQEFFSKLDIELNFARLEIKMFPPATVLREVVVHHGPTVINADAIAIEFSLLNLLSNKISVERVRLQDGKLLTEMASGGGGKFFEQLKQAPPLISTLFSLYQTQVYRQLPLNLKKIALKNIQIVIGDIAIGVENFDLKFFESRLYLNGELNDVPIGKNESLGALKVVAQVERERIRVNKLEVQNKLDKYSFKGNLFQENKEILVNGGGTLQVGVQTIVKQFVPQLATKFYGGAVQADIKLDQTLLNPTMRYSIKLIDVDSDYVRLDTMLIEGTRDERRLKVDFLELKRNKGNVKLLRPLVVYDFVKKAFADSRASLYSHNIHTTDGLYILREAIFPLKGYMEGAFDLLWDKSGIVFEMADGFSLKNFKVDISKGKNKQRPILINPELQFNKGIFIVNFDNDVKARFDLGINFQNSSIAAVGEVRADSLYFDCISEKMDLEEFGPISGVKFTGQGTLRAEIKGPFDDVKFNFSGAQKNFSVAGLYLGKVQPQIQLRLGEIKVLDFNKIVGEIGNSTYRGQGKLILNDDLDIGLNMNIPKASSKDIKTMYGFIPIDLQVPARLYFSYASDFLVEGKIARKEFKVSGDLVAQGITWWNEEFDIFQTHFSYENERLQLKEIALEKRSGKLKGWMDFNFQNLQFNYDATLSGLRLRDIALYRNFSLGLDGLISGHFKGQKAGKDFFSDSTLRITNAKVENIPVNNSLITIHNDKTDVFIQANLLGNVLKANSFLNMDILQEEVKRSQKMSHLNMEIETYDIPQLLGILSPHNVTNASAFGRFAGSLDATFTFGDWRNFDLNFEIKDFLFRQDDVRLLLDRDKRRVVINKGVIDRWEVSIGDKNNRIQSYGEGILGKKAVIKNAFQVSSYVLTNLSPKIQRSNGEIDGTLVFINEADNYSTHVVMNGHNINLKWQSIPGSFEDISFKVVLENNEILLEKLTAKYGNGQIGVEGNITMKLPFPQVELDVVAEHTRIPFLPKSFCVISSKALLTGKSLPYLLEGNVSIAQAEVLDDPKDLYHSQKSSTAQSKFLPAEVSGQGLEFLQFQLNVDALDAIKIRNQFADVSLKGRATVGGTSRLPLLFGELAVVPATSKFIFSGHDFMLKEGTILLNGKNMPDYKFVGNSVVNEYAIKLDISGQGEEANIRLSSEPSLVKEDILSLLTLGYTSDMSKNLGENDRMSVTSVGIGALLVDQLKLNQGLSSSLGLKLSVLPEFEDNENSLLQGKAGGAESTTGRLKSATKIKLQRTIKKVDLSVSSTVGGSLGQKQEMKVNYDINKIMSLQGIYEIQSSEHEDVEDSNSFGADLKFKWSF